MHAVRRIAPARRVHASRPHPVPSLIALGLRPPGAPRSRTQLPLAMRRGGSEEQIFSTTPKGPRVSDTTTLQTTNPLSSADVPSAPPEAHQRAVAKARNLTKLPDFCYGLLETNPPGRRIVIIRAGERGHYVTGSDSPTMPLAAARVLVDRLNVRLGVTDAQQLAMIAGSAFGFHVPAADPDHRCHKGSSAAMIAACR